MDNNSRIILALDGMSVEKARATAKVLMDYVAGGKANDLIEDLGAKCLSGMGFLLRMLDPKLHDILNTMANRMRKYKKHAHFVTIHASNSSAALREAAKVANECGLKAIAVTVTTDINTRQCKSIFGDGSTRKVLQFVRRARAAGVHGIVCSTEEVAAVRKVWPGAIIIVPGVRSIGESVHDQQRVGTPYQAILDGADYIVVGRQILEKKTAEAKIAEAQRINMEVSHALIERNCPIKKAA